MEMTAKHHVYSLDQRRQDRGNRISHASARPGLGNSSRDGYVPAAVARKHANKICYARGGERSQQIAIVSGDAAKSSKTITDQRQTTYVFFSARRAGG